MPAVDSKLQFPPRWFDLRNNTSAAATAAEDVMGEGGGWEEGGRGGRGGWGSAGTLAARCLQRQLGQSSSAFRHSATVLLASVQKMTGN